VFWVDSGAREAQQGAWRGYVAHIRRDEVLFLAKTCHICAVASLSRSRGTVFEMGEPATLTR